VQNLSLKVALFAVYRRPRKMCITQNANRTADMQLCRQVLSLSTTPVYYAAVLENRITAGYYPSVPYGLLTRKQKA